MLYDAFLSYSHAADGRLAPALQSGLQQFAKPWNRLRAVRVFRDKTGLSATPALWSAIEVALDGSEYFVLLASPRSAQSHWVQKEVEHWLARRPANNMLVVLTDGEIVWNHTVKDFDWEATTALPPAMRGKLTEEPLWVDMRWAMADDQLLLRNPRFRDVVADLSSALRGIPKDQLTGEDVRQHRKAVILRRSAIAGLAMLAAAVSVAAIVALGQKNLAQQNAALAKQNELTALANADRATKSEALAKQNEQTAIANAARATKNETLARQNLELAQQNEARAQENQRHAEQNAAEARRQSERSLARQLAAQSEFLRGRRGELPRAALLAVEAVRRYPSADTDQSLRNALAILPRQTRALNLGGSVAKAVFDAKVSTLLIMSEAKAQVWDLASGTRTTSVKSQDGSYFDAMALSLDGQKFALATGCKIVVYDAKSGSQLSVMDFNNHIIERRAPNFRCDDLSMISFSPNGRLLVAAYNFNATLVWNIETGQARQIDGRNTSIAFSPDGQNVASAGHGSFGVWSTKDWKRTFLESGPPRSYGAGVVFSPGRGNQIGVVTGYGVAVWVLPGDSQVFDKQRYRGIMGLPGDFFTRDVAITFNSYRNSDQLDNNSLDEGSLIAASSGNEAVVWEMDAMLGSGREIARMAHEQPIISLGFSRDARRLLTVSVDHTAAVWSVPVGKEVARMVSATPLRAAGFSVDNEVWTIDADGIARAWDLSHARSDTNAAGRFLTRQHESSVMVWDLREPGDWFTRKPKGYYAAVWNNGEHFLAADYVWTDEPNTQRTLEGFAVDDLSEGKRLLFIKQAEIDKEADPYYSGVGIKGVSFSPNGSYVAITGSAAWEIASGRKLPLAGEGGRLRALVFSPDSRRAAGIEPDGTMRVVEIPSGRLLTRIPAAEADSDARFVFSPDGRYLLRTRGPHPWASVDQEPRVWDTRAMAGRAELSTIDGKPIDAETFTADSKYALMNYDTAHIVIAYNLETRRTTEFKSDGYTYMATSPTEPLVAIASGNKVALWNPRTGTEIARFDHFGVSSVTFSANGTYLATGGKDGLLRVWETATRRELARVMATDGVGFSSDGRYVGGVAWHPEDRVKDACERLTRNLTQDEWKLHFEGQPHRKTCSQLK